MPPLAVQEHERPWVDARLTEVRKRLAAADSALDRGVLLREGARLQGGTWLLVDESLRAALLDLDLARFGLELRDTEEAQELRVQRRLPLDVPKSLVEDLLACLPCDPTRRRVEPSAPPDGAFLRLGPHRRYRNPSQKAAMRAMLTMPPGSSLLATLATGSGKSLLFQAGIRWLNERAVEADEVSTGIVLVPTVSLALDHVESTRAEIPKLKESEALVGGSADREGILMRFAQGRIPLLFMAPEMLMGSSRERFLDAARPSVERPSAARGRIAAVFIDEAHIIESWGRSFRPDYQRLPSVIDSLREHNPDLRVLLLSATVDKSALSLLRDQYDRGDFLHVAEGAPRVEFDVIAQRFRSTDERDDALVRLLDLLPRPAVVYTTRVEAAETLARRLRDRGYRRLAAFTGDTRHDRRAQIVRDWRSGALDLVVATSAFGMGVNHPGVRVVVHACVPESASRWYQEVGRAGRDGHQALSLVLAAPDDEGDAVSLALGTILKRETAGERWEALASAGSARPSEGGRLRHRLDLRAAADRHENPGQLNMRWNKALLVQLQRYRALEVEGLDESSDVWNVTMNSDWVGLLDGGARAEELLDRLFECRDAEQERYRRHVRRFMRLLLGKTADVPCQWADIFRTVDAARPWCDPCGRCPACRASGRLPTVSPTPAGITYSGLDRTWPHTDRPYRSPEVILVPDSREPDLASLAEALSDLGIEQWLVPKSLAHGLAVELSGLVRTPGLVLNWDELLEDRWTPAVVPTAALFGAFGTMEQRASLFERVRYLSTTGGMDLRAWVCGAGDMVGNRRLTDLATATAPITLEDARAEGLECR